MAGYLKPKRAAWLLADLERFCTVTNIVDKFEVQPHREMIAEMAVCIPKFAGVVVNEQLMRRQIRKLYLTARYTFKSHIGRAFCVYLILRFPNISISIYRATKVLAKDMLAAIQDILTQNREILETFGNLSTGAPRWSTLSITVNTRTRPGIADPTITVSGLKSSMAGTHPDVAWLDDIVTEINCDSPVEMAKAEKLIDSSYPVLPMWGVLLITGTHWSTIDAYSMIRKKNRELEDAGRDPDFLEYIRTVYYLDENGDQQLFFPAFLTEDFINRQRETLPARWFASWYFQEVRELGMAPFPRDRLKFFEGEYHTTPYHQLAAADLSPDPIRLYVVLVVDPALTGSASSDNFGINVIGFGVGKRWFFLESREFRALPSSAGDQIIDLLREYEPDTFLIETQNADVEMMARISKWVHDTGMKVAIRSYSSLQDELPGKRGKHQRILALEPRAKGGRLFFRKGKCGPVIRQMDSYPSLIHDDCLDAAAMARKLENLAPREEKPKYEEDDREPVDLFHQQLDQMERKPDEGPRNVARGSWTGPLH